MYSNLFLLYRKFSTKIKLNRISNNCWKKIIKIAAHKLEKKKNFKHNFKPIYILILY